MLERRQIVALWKATANAVGPGAAVMPSARGVLVTLVGVEGSSYRRPGARLLTLGSAGGHAGTISGGCLEAEVVARAAWIARAGAAVERYEMTFDDTSDIPFGLGCGGTVDLLFEPVAADEGRALMQAMEAALEGRASRVVSFLPGGGRGLRRAIFDAAGAVVFASAGLSAEKIDCARRLEPGQAYEGRFVERLETPQRLIVLGAGDDAKPLVEMAAMLGWTVIVADGRRHQAVATRFPSAARVVWLAGQSDAQAASGPGAEWAAELEIGARDAVVLLSHSYEQDREMLTGSLPRQPRFLGLLGSRHRSSVLIGEVALRLGYSVGECCARVFAPVGIDLGGDGPEAVALAIVAQVQGVSQGRTFDRGRLTEADVAEQIARGGASRYLQAQCALDGA